MSEYRIIEVLLENAAETLFRGVRDDERPVVLKVLAPTRHRQNDVRRLEQDLRLGQKAAAPGVAKPLAIDTFDGRPALVLEDFGARPLSHLLGEPLPPERFLPIGIQLAAALAEVHARGIVHKDLKPENVLVNPATSEVRISGFGIASLLPREQPTALAPGLVEGSLPYLSPEQTGRMNRALDSRTDLYSLGIVLYELLTGRLPFQARDPLEWMHCHIARTPHPPAALVSGVEPTLTRIVLKLLAKSADERYQTARGVQCDLERCLADWLAQRRIEPFEPGDRDVPDRLQIPQRLYGRQAEVARLFAAFERVVALGDPELFLLAGPPGIGKSFLVHELQRPLLRERGSFVAGKFEQFKQEVPYSTLLQALSTLVLGTLAESEARVAQWREAMLNAVAGSGRLLVDLVPQLARLIGEQPPVAELPPAEARHRFRRTLKAALGVFASPESPLVLFLDDLQWSEPATLELVEELVGAPRPLHLLIIGAYRDGEVPSTHPLARLRDRMQATTALVETIHLGPLAPSHVELLIADAVRATPDRVRPLAALVFEKTAGNPFFVVQFLTALEHEGLLSLDERTLTWDWDLDRIRDENYTDNVVDFLVRRLGGLPAATQETLRTAACIGTRSPVALLELVHGKSAEETSTDLGAALREGLVVHTANTCAFAHDRVQQAAYSQVPEPQRRALHLRIGRLLLAHTAAADRSERVFDIATHLNQGAELIVDPAERLGLARLDLAAGQRAAAATAFEDGARFLAAGLGLLPASAWDEHYRLTFDLHLERARCELVSGQFQTAEALLETLMAHARTVLDEATATRLHVELHVLRGEFPSAAQLALTASGKLGLAVAPRPSRDDVLRAARALLDELCEEGIEGLSELPEMADPTSLALMDLLAAALAPSFFAQPYLHDLLACEMVRLSLRHGLAATSAMGFGNFGGIIGRLLGRWNEAAQFGRLSLCVVERQGPRASKAKVYQVVAAFIDTRLLSPREAIGSFLRAFKAGCESGDLTFASYAATNIPWLALTSGEPLAGVAAELEQYGDFVRRAAYGPMHDVLLCQRLFVNGLRGLAPGLAACGLADAESRALEARFEKNTFVEGWLHALVRLEVAVFFGREDDAWRAMARAREIGGGAGPPFEIELTYFFALALALRASGLEPQEREPVLADLQAELRVLREWAEHNPSYLHRVALVAAELARIEGRDLEAMRGYAEAARLAHAGGFVQNEALALERAAAFHGERGFPLFAVACLREARACYARWGAAAKVAELDRVHPELLEERPASSSATFTARPDELDLLSLVKASQAISRELDREHLVRKLMELAIEHGGAREGWLVLVRDGSLVLEARAGLGEKGVEVERCSPSPALTSPLLPASVLQLALRTQEPVLLEDAATSAFASDPHIAARRPRSVLCLPLVRQGEVVGLLYLGNDLLAGAFTRGRLGALEVLGAQAAISIENVLLLEKEKAAREVAEAAERRASFLAEASPLLAESLDYERVLTRLAQVVVRFLADWCVVDLIEGGEVRRLVSAHRDPAKNEVLKALRRYPASTASPSAAAEAIRTGQAILRPELSDADLRNLCVDDEHCELVRTLGLRSLLVVPLSSRGEVRGALSLASAAPERRYGPEDLELARELAHRAALAIDNASLYRDAREAIRVRDDFLSVASHELYTPMTSLMLAVHGLSQLTPERRQQPVSFARSLGVIDRQSRRLKHLVGELLDGSRAGAGQLPFTFKEGVDFVEIVREVVDRFHPELERDSVRVSVTAPDELCGAWDRSRLDQLVTNLVANALKFGEKRPVEITLSQADGVARLVVRDHGIGIEPSQKNRLFRRFARGVSAAHYGGLGLGLYICRVIVEAHGGAIGVESEPGDGATFSVTLPRAAPRREAD